jgi:amino acid adenylation domain-containing protein
MSLRELYRTLSSLSPEKRTLYSRRIERSGFGEATDEILPRPGGSGPVPAALVQQRLWLLDQMEPGNPFYNLPLLCFVLDGGLRPAALAGAFATIEARHEALRTTFSNVGGNPFQVIAPADPRAFPRVDLSALPEPRRMATAWGLARDEARRPFDLARGPLWRTTLLHVAERQHLLLVNLHHIISDAWSIGVLYRELTTLYDAYVHELPSPLPGLPIQYPDFALWQRLRLSGELLAAELDFWRRQLDGAPERLELPIDQPRPPVRAFRGRRQILPLPAALPEALARVGQATGSSLFILLLAGYAALLHRLTRQEDFVVAAPVAGRSHVGTEGLIGFFVNTVVLRLRPTPSLSFADFLTHVRNVVLDVYEHQELPFDRLVEEVKPRRDPAYGPIFQTMFSLQNTAIPDLDLAGLKVHPQGIDNGASQTDLILFAGMTQGRLGILQMEYDVALFEDPTIARFGGHLLNLFAAAVEEPGRPLAALPLLTAAERHQLLVEQGGIRAGMGPQEPLHRLFAARVAEAPGAVAVVCGAEQLDYGQLEARANRLARRLRSLGVGPEVRVGLCLPRSLDLVVGILGILKAGGAYVPLDPDYPAERLQYLLDDAGLSVLVTQEALLPRLPRPPLHRVLLDSDAAALAAESAMPPEPPTDGGVTAASLAYVIYTSGSTGRPKGALVTHGNVARLLAAARERLACGPKDVWTLFHSFAFDFSVWELWGALATGGSVVVVPRPIASAPESFLGLLQAEGVTILSQTPSAFRQLLQALDQEGWNGSNTADTADIARGLALRYVVFGGESLDPGLLRPWLDRFPGEPRLVNMYGITETTVHVTSRVLSAGDAARPGRSPLGAPLRDLSLHLLDAFAVDLEPVPLGVTGEIYVGGDGVCRGYLGRPELTAERFLPDPFSGRPGARLYRSGDLGRRLPDGDVLYLGRADQQVKVRGMRIEPGEVEAALGRHPAVAGCAVAVREGVAGEPGLVAWYALSAQGAANPPSPTELRAFLAESLPDFLVPTAFVPLPSLPLTAHGKVDRRALPDPDRGSRPDADSGFLPPRTPLEELVAGAWREVLGIERIGIEDDFFGLGGHSLLATRLVSRLRDRLRLPLSAQLVFQAPTVALMAAALAERAARPDRPEEPAEAPALVALPRRTRRGV